MKIYRSSSNPAIESGQYTFDLLTEVDKDIVQCGSDNASFKHQRRYDHSENPWLLVRAILLAPLALLRTIVVFSLIFFAAFSTTAILRGRAVNDMRGFWRKFIEKGMVYGTRVALFAVGMYWFNYEYVTEEEMQEMQSVVRSRKHTIEKMHQEDQKLPQELVNDKSIDPYIIACNHVSTFDSFVLKHCMGSISALAKADVRNGVLGKVCENLGCLFVDKKNSKQIISEIYRRTEKYYEIARDKSAPRPSRLIIYPEGTTTSGHQLIRFHNGAMRAGAPIQPVMIRFPYKYFNICWTTSIEAWKFFLIHWTQLYIPITIVIFPKYIPDEEERQDPSYYAENLRRVMCCGANLHAGPNEHKMTLDPSFFNRYHKAELTKKHEKEE